MKVHTALPEEDHTLIEDLQANFNYSCILMEYVGNETLGPNGEGNVAFNFSTDYEGTYILL